MGILPRRAMRIKTIPPPLKTRRAIYLKHEHKSWTHSPQGLVLIHQKTIPITNLKHYHKNYTNITKKPCQIIFYRIDIKHIFFLIKIIQIFYSQSIYRADNFYAVFYRDEKSRTTAAIWHNTCYIMRRFWQGG